MKLLKTTSSIFLFFLLFHGSSYALTSAKDTITTSRPSASAPLATNQAANDGSLTIVDNGSFYLASDSAKLLADTGQTESTVIVASQSAANTPASNQRTIYLGAGGTTAAIHHKGTAVIVPITALHTIKFTTVIDIPAGGNIYLTFPGAANNSASPSATAFAFNNLNASGGLPSTIVTNNITCNSSSTVTSPTILCVTTAIVTGGTTITFLIGCTAQSSGACTTQAPRMINPTKIQSAGVADIWKVTIQTRDSLNTTIESATISVGTIESVIVRATIDPSLTFTITGISNGTAWSNGNAGCSSTETTNTGIPATSTEVNLGTVSNTPSGTDTKIRNIAGQRIDITTNGANGYILTATSSSQLINPATGYFINSNTTPAAFPAGTNYFGVHPCGLDVITATWNSSTSQTCNSYISGSTNPICLYAWPSANSAITLASDSTGPIGVNAVSTGNGVTSISYAVGADAGVPPGEYRSAITYIATPAF